MRTVFEMLWGVLVMLYFLIFNKEEARQFDYDNGFGEIEE